MVAKKLSKYQQLKKRAQRIVRPLIQRQKKFLARRPHRSFRLTKRRDYVRSLDLPGYWSFTNYVRQTLWRNKKLFGTVVVVHAVVTALVLGIMSQDTFQLLNDTVKNLRENVVQVDVGESVQNLAVVSGVIVGAFSSPLTELQQVYAGFIALMGWLVTVWLLRQTMAGYAVRFRDGLYNAGAPIIPTFIVLLLVMVQLVPLSLAVLSYVSAEVVMAFEDTLFTTLFWIVEAILILLSLYWLSSSFIALVVVTLPGMYPWQAIKAASDLVVGRRVRVLYRLCWLLLIVLIIWIIALLPAVLLANIAALKWLPLVPIVVLVLSSFSLVFSATYVYLLYRKMVDDVAPPA